MKTGRVLWLLAGLSISIVAAHSACDNSSCQGSVTCACYPNGTCNGSLTCASNLCVQIGDAGPTSSSSSSSSGGATNEAGVGDNGDGGEGGTTLVGEGGISTEGGTQPSGEVLANTDLSTGWYVNYISGTAGTQGFSSTPAPEYCISAGSSNGYSWGLDYPDPSSSVAPFDLTTGSSYTLSYLVKGTDIAQGVEACGTGTIEAKIGMAAAPYTAVQTFCDTPTASFTKMSHTFTVTGAPATGLGIALQANVNTGGQVCFANVTLLAN